jgi:hypothetical protein
MELTYIDNFNERRPISIHYRPVNWEQARTEKNYSRFFRSKFCSVELQIDQIAQIIVKNAWGPIIWDNGKAGGKNFRASGFMALDFDSPDYSLAQALEDWADTVHIIAVSKSHQRPKNGIKCDRFRLIAPWASVIYDYAQYRFNIKKLITRYGADEACKDGARFFFPCPKVVSINTSGYLQPVLAKPVVTPRIPARRYRDQGMVRKRTIIALRHIFPISERNAHCFMVAKDLYDAGYDKDDIFREIVSSPTYQGRVDQELAEEIKRCIESGINSVEEGLAYVGS